MTRQADLPSRYAPGKRDLCRSSLGVSAPHYAAMVQASCDTNLAENTPYSCQKNLTNPSLGPASAGPFF